MYLYERGMLNIELLPDLIKSIKLFLIELVERLSDVHHKMQVS